MAKTQQREQRWSIEDIRRAFQRYCDEIDASDRKATTKATYVQHADRFVRWLAGEVDLS
jgi:isochorismate synthase EntC